MKEKLNNVIDKNKKYIYFLLPLVLIAILFLIIILNGVHKTDVSILKNISLIVSDNMTIVMRFITSLCSPVFLLCVVLLCLIIFKDKRISVGITIALFFSTISNLALKAIFSRQRPLEFMLIDERGYSFPSGHSMVSIVFYGFLIYICYKLIKQKSVKIICITLLSLVILLIAFSRLYLGVHYPTDVLAGLTSGYIFLGLYIIIFKKYILKNEKLNK